MRCGSSPPSGCSPGAAGQEDVRLAAAGAVGAAPRDGCGELGSLVPARHGPRPRGQVLASLGPPGRTAGLPPGGAHDRLRGLRLLAHGDHGRGRHRGGRRGARTALPPGKLALRSLLAHPGSMVQEWTGSGVHSSARLVPAQHSECLSPSLPPFAPGSLTLALGSPPEPLAVPPQEVFLLGGPSLVLVPYLRDNRAHWLHVPLYIPGKEDHSFGDLTGQVSGKGGVDLAILLFRVGNRRKSLVVDFGRPRSE